MSKEVVIFLNSRRTALESQQPYFAAHRAGFDVVLIADKPLAMAPGVAKQIITVDTYDRERTAEAVLTVARTSAVAGIFTWGDRDVELVAYLSEKLGLPGNSRDSAAAVRNKYLGRRHLAARNESLTPRYARVLAADDLQGAADRVGFPAILKPAGASGSKGIYRANNFDELAAAFERLHSVTIPSVDPIYSFYPQEMILEEWLPGTEHSVEGIVFNGELAAWLTTDKEVGPPHYIETLQCHPSLLPRSLDPSIDKMCRDVIGAVGFEVGAFHLEFKVDAAGTLKVVEFNGRAGGGYITSHLLPMASGYPFLQETIEAVAKTSRPMPPVREPVLYAGSAKLLTHQSGKFVELAGLDAALSVAGIEGFTFESNLGVEILQPPEDYVTSVLATFIGRATSPDVLRSLLAEATGLCRPTIRASR